MKVIQRLNVINTYTTMASFVRIGSIRKTPSKSKGSNNKMTNADDTPMMICRNRLLEKMRFTSSIFPLPLWKDRCRWVATTIALVINPIIVTTLPTSEKIPKSD